jgi:hypothetical protein
MPPYRETSTAKKMSAEHDPHHEAKGRGRILIE